MFKSISYLTISIDLYEILAPEVSLLLINWRDQFPCSQKTLFLDITRPYNPLVSENTSKLKTNCPPSKPQPIETLRKPPG